MLRANGNVYIDTNENLGNNGIVATIALQNTADLNGDGVTSGRAAAADANPEFSGEISVSQCGLPGTTCAPPGINFPEYLVVNLPTTGCRHQSLARSAVQRGEIMSSVRLVNMETSTGVQLSIRGARSDRS